MSVFSLEPFSEDNMKLVLSWRNTERIRSNMLDDSIITENEHCNFLNSLKVDSSKAYFVVKLNGRAVSCLYFNDLDKSTVTWGCYIGVDKVIPGLFVALVVLAGKFAFSEKKVDCLRSEVACHNFNPIKLNKYFNIPIVSCKEEETVCGNKVKFNEYVLKRYNFIGLVEKAYKVMPSSVRKAIENFKVE